MLQIIISSLISYLIGSISPSYILGKLLKGIDIKETWRWKCRDSEHL